MAGTPSGRKPLVAQIAIRPQRYAARGKFGMELPDPRLQLAPLDADTEIADAQREQLLVFERDPGRLR